MLHHKGSQLRVQVVEENHITVTHLIQHGNQMSLTIGSTFCGLQRTDIRDITVVADSIVVNHGFFSGEVTVALSKLSTAANWAFAAVVTAESSTINRYFFMFQKHYSLHVRPILLSKVLACTVLFSRKIRSLS